MFGGTFDPPHYGHLVAAQEAAWRLALARVVFLPARQNPLKVGEPISAADDRLRMVERALADDPRFVVSRLDLDRPPPSYTVDLLRLLQTDEQVGPEADLFFLAGADLLPELPAWHRPAEVLQRATLVAVVRPGWPTPDVEAVIRAFPTARGRIVALPIPGVDISSTEIRRRVRAGQPIRYLTPVAVEAYIRARGLYGAG